MSNGVRVATPAPGCARIVLDTNAARNLGESEGLPPYLDVLIEMTAAGHVVHLADGAWAELLAQRHRGSLGDVVFERMMTRLVPLLSTEVPVFLSGNDLRGYLGEDMGEPAWTESEFVGTSQRAMALLRAATVLSPNAQLPEGHRAAEEVLQEVRDAWIAHFDRMLEELPPTAEDDELGGPTFEAFCRRVDDESDLPHPPMSKRMDLGIRYAWRQHVRKNRERGAYGGAIVNVLSVASFRNTPVLSTHGATKPAAWALTNGLRHDLRTQGTQVLALHVGPVDTDLTAAFNIPKSAPKLVADKTFDALEAGEGEVMVDDVSVQAKESLTAPSPVYLNV